MTGLPPLSDRLASALGDRYVVEEEVGSGGMAVVFAARDLRHNRRVAVKALRPELALSLGADRFLREIEFAAGLQHPHILPVYDSGASDGTFYYVMPLVDGESLSVRIARGPLPLADAVGIAIEVADALAYAHERGLIHRDIKPENIMLSGGHALVTDFGIARVVGAAGRLTATGMAIGTPLYMSPEQALGSSEVDARSDVYSLASVLYETLTGHHPFSGASLQAIIAQSISAPRPRARKARRDVPAALDDVIVKGLATEPTDRFQSAHEFRAALAGAIEGKGARRRTGLLATVARPMVLFGAVAVALVAGGLAAWHVRAPHVPAGESVAAGSRVIAALPFTAIGPGTSGMSEGLVDLIATNLDGVGGIRIIDPRTALNHWRGRSGAVDRASMLAIGRDLGASSILTGTVVAAGPLVRVNAELVDASGTLLAKAQADGHPDSLLAIVDTLSIRLLRDVWRASTPVPALRVSAITTGSLGAIRSYLEGEQALRRSDWAVAARAYSRAIEQDSLFALAYLRLLTADEWLGVGGPTIRALDELVRRRLDRLPQRDRSIAVGQLLYHDGKQAALDTALALTTRYPDALDVWVLLGETRYHSQGLLAATPEEIRAPFERALTIDSTFTLAFTHILEESALDGDSARYFHELRRFRAIAGAADTTVTLYQQVGDAAWGSRPAATAALRAIVEQPAYILRIAAQAALMNPGGAERFIDDLGRMAGTPRGDAAQVERNQLLLATGRLAELRRAWTRSVSVTPEDATAFPPGWRGMLIGFGDSTASLDALRRTMQRWMPKSFGLLTAEEYGVAMRDTALVARSIAEALGRDTVRMPMHFRPAFEIARGWGTLAAGDTARGLRQMESVLARADFTLSNLMPIPRFVRAVALSRSPPTRDEGVRLLRYAFRNDSWLFPAQQLALREALLASGNRAAADTIGVTMTRLWRMADPSARAAAARAWPRMLDP